MWIDPGVRLEDRVPAEEAILFDEKLVGTDENPRSIVLTLRMRPSSILDEDLYRLSGASKSRKEEGFMSFGISQVRFYGYQDTRRPGVGLNHRQDADEPRETFNLYYRGDFEVALGRRFRCAQGFDSNADRQRCINARSWLGINVVDIDEYLYSVVPMENSDVQNIEAVKAQAHWARTYAINKAIAARVSGRNYDFRVTIGDQAYYGVDREMVKATRHAVDATAGMVVVSELTGAITQTEFYACGENSVDVPRNPYMDERAHPLAAVEQCQSHPLQGHGRGGSQIASSHLANSGFCSGNRPTPGSDHPAEICKPWSAEEITAYYFPNTRIENMYDSSSATAQ